MYVWGFTAMGMQKLSCPNLSITDHAPPSLLLWPMPLSNFQGEDHEGWQEGEEMKDPESWDQGEPSVQVRGKELLNRCREFIYTFSSLMSHRTPFPRNPLLGSSGAWCFLNWSSLFMWFVFCRHCWFSNQASQVWSVSSFSHSFHPPLFLILHPHLLWLNFLPY